MALLVVWSGIALTVLITSLSSCTLSYQNISTHGTAQDVVDENQTASPDVKADITADVSMLPKVPNGPKGSALNPYILDSVGPK